MRVRHKVIISANICLQEAAKVESQMKLIARPMYSNPPLHGALLVSKILHDGDLKQQWYQVREVTCGCYV
jgi:aspartate/tyrosine/aromatic aminotransferase